MKLGVYGDYKRALSRGVRAGEAYGPPKAERARRAREEGLEYVPLVWIPRCESPKEGVVSLEGKTGLFAFNNSGCIANPQVRRRALEGLERAIVECESGAVIVDALRYPSPHDGELFISCFCPHCRSHAEELGIRLEHVREALKRGLGGLKSYPHVDPELGWAVAELVRLRQHVVAGLFEEAREKCRELGVSLWAAVFPPGLAWMVGQNYTLIEGLVEELHVMLYHRCSGAACLNRELASLKRLLGGLGAPEGLARALTLIETDRSPDELEAGGVEEEAILEEAERARGIVGDKTVPILWLDEVGERLAGRLRGYGKITFFSPSR